LLEGWPRAHLGNLLDCFRGCLDLHGWGEDRPGMGISDARWNELKETAIPLIVERLRKAS
jgi:hypothetical protein